MAVRIRSGLLLALVAGLVLSGKPVQAQSAAAPETLSWQAHKPRVDSSSVVPASYAEEEPAPAPAARRPSNPPRNNTAPRSNVRVAGNSRYYGSARQVSQQEDVPPPRSNGPAMNEHPSMSSPYSGGMSEFYDDSSCDSCGGDCGYGCGPRRGTWIVGADYVLMRAHFSEPTAFVHRHEEVDENDNSTLTDTTVENNYPYESNFRAFIGYRLCDCNTEVLFTYSRFETSSAKASGIVPEDLSDTFAGQLENNASVPGEQLFTDTGLAVNTYDIDFAKCVPLGGCESGCRAPWSLKYSAGLRIADVHRFDNSLLTSEEDGDVRSGFITADYWGIGPRIGLEGRRHCGHSSCWSLYAKGDLSLLLGDYETRRETRAPATDPEATTIQIDNITRLVPVADIELGTSYQWTQHLVLSLGWQFQCWWDLGMFESIQGTNFGPQDDSNIMSFDGLFVRTEFTF